MVLAMFLPARSDAGVPRERIALPHQFVFAVVMAAYLAVLSLIGGAALARYMLPAIPLRLIISVSTVWRRIPGRAVLITPVLGAFCAGTFINPHVVFAS